MAYCSILHVMLLCSSTSSQSKHIVILYINESCIQISYHNIQDHASFIALFCCAFFMVQWIWPTMWWCISSYQINVTQYHPSIHYNKNWWHCRNYLIWEPWYLDVPGSWQMVRKWVITLIYPIFKLGYNPFTNHLLNLLGHPSTPKVVPPKKNILNFFPDGTSPNSGVCPLQWLVGFHWVCLHPWNKPPNLHLVKRSLFHLFDTFFRKP